ncbi:radical SAM family heme chaperone HemW [Sphingoaurantiacus capsulatus]|uniref:radical SAM family heme chaperone HemW n=1 Tax=Sphingoaurantiacus capsulatus TaxID=1771310 RepID=UPI0036D242A1
MPGLLRSWSPPVSDGGGRPLAVYVHWPFCVSKCPYCDFNSHVRASVDEAGWRDALIADLRHEAAMLPDARVVSIFFGGGTPSLMDPSSTAAIIDKIARLWPVAPGVEITLEANPTSVEAARFAGFAAAGVNRVSLGLQALDDASLKLLGRPHDVAMGLAALDVAQTNFDRVSFDLIYARPEQTVDGWQAELTRAIGFGTEHLSLYQLTIEPKTRFASLHASGKLVLPDEDVSAELFETTRAMTAAAGLPAYEVSNHARAGAESRHNLAYWHYADYVGVGPGAHGRRRGVATVRTMKPEGWIAGVRAQGHGMSEEAVLTPAMRAEEALLMGLRLKDGIDAARFRAGTGVALDDAIDARGTAELVGLGLVEHDARGLRLMPAGMLLLNAVIAKVAAS